MTSVLEGIGHRTEDRKRDDLAVLQGGGEVIFKKFTLEMILKRIL